MEDYRKLLELRFKRGDFIATTFKYMDNENVTCIGWIKRVNYYEDANAIECYAIFDADGKIKFNESFNKEDNILNARLATQEEIIYFLYALVCQEPCNFSSILFDIIKMRNVEYAFKTITNISMSDSSIKKYANKLKGTLYEE